MNNFRIAFFIILCTFSCFLLSAQDSGQKAAYDEIARFPGCSSEATYVEEKACADGKMLQYIYKTLKYPAEARSIGIQGTAVITFTVQPDGQLSDFEILKDPGAGCGEAALRVVESMNNMTEKWIPARVDGTAVEFNYFLPVIFKLQGQGGSADELALLNIVLDQLSGEGSDLPTFKSLEAACSSSYVSCKRNKIVGLDLQFADLRGEIPESITSLRDLVWINLEYNHLRGKIPNGLASLPRLEELLVNGNHLTGQKPKDYDRLKRLEIFDESQNVEYLDLSSGKLLDMDYNIDENGAEDRAEQRGAELFKVVEQMPRFPGCDEMKGTNLEKKACADEALLRYVYKNLKYPAIARESGVEGMVLLQYVVAEDGTIRDIAIKRDPGWRCGNAAFWVVNRMNYFPERWNPGIQRGRPVKVLYTFPVKFKLQ